MIMSSSQYIAIAAYVLLLVIMGVVMRGLNHDLSDYFPNGCRGTRWLVGASALLNGIAMSAVGSNARGALRRRTDEPQFSSLPAAAELP